MVTKAAANAACFPPAPQSVVTGPGAQSVCGCGCIRCAAACDGMAAAVFRSGSAAESPGSTKSRPVLASIYLQNLLPTAGQLGVYVRLRGAGRLKVEVTDPQGAVTATGLFSNVQAASFDEKQIMLLGTDGKYFGLGTDPKSTPRAIELIADLASDAPVAVLELD